MADGPKQRKKQKDDPERLNKLRREAARQQQAGKVGRLLQQLAAAAEDADLLADMVDEIATWAQGEPIPAELDTSWGIGEVMAALAREFGRMYHSGGDDADLLFTNLLAKLRENLPELWQAAHAEPSTKQKAMEE